MNESQDKPADTSTAANDEIRDSDLLAADPEGNIAAAAVSTGEPAADEPAVASDPDDLAGFARLGPGTLDSLRFRWSLRRATNGYFVDETIGASQLAVSRGPMSREIALDYIEARYRDATARFEHRRDRLANAPLRARRPPMSPPLAVADAPADSFSGSAAPETAPATEEPGLAQALLAAADKPVDDATTKDSPQTVDLEDVMKRITQLLDER